MDEISKPFDIVNDPELEEKLLKLQKKDKLTYERVIKQMLKISKSPYLAKPLKYDLKGKRRIHIGSFVLIYEINEKDHKVIFSEFEHHDKAYRR